MILIRVEVEVAENWVEVALQVALNEATVVELGVMEVALQVVVVVPMTKVVVGHQYEKTFGRIAALEVPVLVQQGS